LQISRLKLAKTWWKNPVLTGGGLNRLAGFRNTEEGSHQQAFQLQFPVLPEQIGKSEFLQILKRGQRLKPSHFQVTSDKFNLQHAENYKPCRVSNNFFSYQQLQNF
jgi:hypothetical protein